MESVHLGSTGDGLKPTERGESRAGPETGGWRGGCGLPALSPLGLASAKPGFGAVAVGPDLKPWKEKCPPGQLQLQPLAHHQQLKPGLAKRGTLAWEGWDAWEKELGFKRSGDKSWRVQAGFAGAEKG